MAKIPAAVRARLAVWRVTLLQRVWVAIVVFFAVLGAYQAIREEFVPPEHQDKLFLADRIPGPWWSWVIGALLILLVVALEGTYRELRRVERITEAGPEEPGHARSTADKWIEELMLSADADVVDKVHHYRRLVFKAHVDRDCNYHAFYGREGVNMDKTPSSYMVVGTATDSNAPLCDMNMKATDRRTGQELIVRPVCDERFRKVCWIYFQKPVGQGQDFDVEWCFTWPGVMRRNEDFDGINISRFQRGVERIELTWIFDWPLDSYCLWELAGSKPTKAMPQPEYSVDEEGRHVYQWGMDRPTADSFRFEYLTR